MPSKFFRSFKRMGFGFAERDMEYYYPTKNKFKRILTFFEPLWFLTIGATISLGSITLEQKKVSAAGVSGIEGEFQFSPQKKLSLEYWVFRMCDVQRVGIVKSKLDDN